ncbi:MAG: ABC transporter permease [Streptosporangiaceae bacterium]
MALEEGSAAQAVRDRAENAALKIERQLAGLDALELSAAARKSVPVRVWSTIWPMLAAIVITLAIWELVVLSGWKEPWVLPGPRQVLPKFWDYLTDGKFWDAVALTMKRAAVGFAVATAVGVVLGLAVSSSRILRRAFGSLITGLQTMPSIAWFPFAILLFKLSESAILFVVVLGAAPSIANGLISGVDYMPPILRRAGKVMGLRNINLYRFLIMPASLPSFVAGLKQGWAFAWRSLMAGELLVIIGNTQSLGTLLHYNREFSDAEGMIAVMLVILIIGILVDQIFGFVDRTIRTRWGLNSSSD